MRNKIKHNEEKDYQKFSRIIKIWEKGETNKTK